MRIHCYTDHQFSYCIMCAHHVSDVDQLKAMHQGSDSDFPQVCAASSSKLMLILDLPQSCCCVCPGAAFKYIRDVLDEAHLSQDRSAAFRVAVIGSIADLARNESFGAATLILERFPEEHANVVASLADQPELQFKYLQASTQVGL